jgi:glycosyltransferase involved in cell wall biosynthesis/GT2 family glycosyltransferase
MMIKASVIIPTFERIEKLKNNLLSLSLQNYPPGSFEVLVIDDNPSPDVRDTVTVLDTAYEKFYLEGIRGGAASARNIGASVARGDFLIFLDDDVRATPELISSHMAMHERRPGIVVVGKILPLDGTGMLNKIMLSYNYEHLRHGDIMDYNGATGNLSVAKEDFAMAGGFDERFVRFEDTELGFRLKAKALLTFIFSEKALAYHDCVYSQGDIAKTMFTTGNYMVKALRENPSMLSEKYSRKIRLDMTEHLNSGIFRPLTEGEKTAFMAQSSADEKLYEAEPSVIIERRLRRNYRKLIEYSFREGVIVKKDGLGKSRSIFEYEFSKADPRHCLVRLPLLLSSTVNSMSGYGSIAAFLRRELARHGFFVAHDPLDGLTGEAKKRKKRTNTPLSGEYSRPLQLALSPPHAFTRAPRHYTINYTTHETTMIPHEWLSPLNSMDEVWVISEFNRVTFQECGVSVPLHVMHPGIDISEFRPFAAAVPFDLDERFCFLAIGNSHYYKGLDILLRAFLEEFRTSSDVCLLIKTYRYFEPEAGDIRKLLMSLRSELKLFKKPVVMILDDYFVDSMAGLYNAADAFISTSRGEGLCLPLLEAMACQMPVISSNFGGKSDFLNEENCFIIEHRLVDVPKNDQPYHHSGMWAEPSIEGTRMAMRRAFEHGDEAARKAAAGRDHIIARWDSRKRGDDIARHLLEIYGGT